MINKVETFLDEEELIRLLQINKTIAIGELYKKYSAPLLGRIQFIVKQPELAEEVLMEVFLKAWATAHNFKKYHSRLFTWLSHIATTCANDFIKSDLNKNSVSNHSKRNCVYLARTENGIQFLRDNMGMKELVNGLSEEWSEVLYTVYFLGKTEEEAALILNLPIDIVRSRVHLAIMELRRVYDQ